MHKSRGPELEEIVDRFLTQRLLRDFVYFRPRVHLSRSSRELCDLLVVLEGVCIPIQLKARGQDDAHSGRKVGRWAQKEAVAAGQQVSGAVRKIKARKITALHQTQGEVTFSSGVLIPSHGLSVVEYLGIPVKLPSAAKHASPTGVPIHYFTMNDLFNAVELCGSLPDFITYLEQRSLLSLDVRSLLGAERDLFGMYLLAGNLHRNLTLEDVRGTWAMVMSLENGAFKRRQEHDIFVRFFNGGIERLHNRDPEMEKYEPSELQEAIEPRDKRRGYLKMAAVLNRVLYVERREIGKRTFQMAKAVSKWGGERYFYVFAPDDKWVLVFMVSGNENRTGRIRSFYGLVLTVLHKTGRRNAVGVVYPPLKSSLGLEFLLIENLDTNTLNLGEVAEMVPSARPIPLHKFPQPLEDALLPQDEDFT